VSRDLVTTKGGYGDKVSPHALEFLFEFYGVSQAVCGNLPPHNDHRSF